MAATNVVLDAAVTLKIGFAHVLQRTRWSPRRNGGFMDWRVKLVGQKLVDVLLPGDMGLSVHRRLQSRFGQVGRFNGKLQDYNIDRGTKLAMFLRDEVSFRFEGARILEVGTGWSGTDLILYYLLGADEIWTCDQLRHLEVGLVRQMAEAFGHAIEVTAERSGVQAADIRQRHEALTCGETLADLLRVCRVKYIALSVFHEIDFPARHFDLFYSYSVLQRVPPADLTLYLRTAHRSIKHNGYALNVIHHSDHNARHQRDLGEFDYLRFGDRLYDCLQSKRHNYQNRMRHAEVVDRFRECGFQPVAEQLRREPQHKISQVRLAKRFQKVPLDDLLVQRTQLLCRRVEASHRG